jgi:hypothetical protein
MSNRLASLNRPELSAYLIQYGGLDRRVVSQMSLAELRREAGVSGSAVCGDCGSILPSDRSCDCTINR